VSARISNQITENSSNFKENFQISNLKTKIERILRKTYNKRFVDVSNDSGNVSSLKSVEDTHFQGCVLNLKSIIFMNFQNFQGDIDLTLPQAKEIYKSLTSDTNLKRTKRKFTSHHYLLWDSSRDILYSFSGQYGKHK